MTAVLATLCAAIADLAIAIQPVIPAGSAKLLGLMGLPEELRTYAALADPARYARLAGAALRPRRRRRSSPRFELPAEV